MNKFAPFVEWLWKHRDVQAAFDVGVLTEPHRKNDDSIPSPALTVLESKDLFRLLEKRELVHPHSSPNAYYINKIEWYKWEELIRELKKPRWRHSTIYLNLVKSAWIVLAALVGGIVGGYTKAMGEKIADLTVKIVERQSTQVSSDKAANQSAYSAKEKENKTTEQQGGAMAPKSDRPGLDHVGER